MASDVEQLWRRKGDDELLKAGAELASYTEAGESAIRAELQRRGLVEPPPTARPVAIPTDPKEVAVPPHPLKQILGPALLGAVTDSNQRVRVLAFQALSEITGQAFGPNATEWQTWWCSAELNRR